MLYLVLRVEAGALFLLSEQLANQVKPKPSHVASSASISQSIK